MKNKLAITSLIILLASVPLIVHVVSADGILSLPDNELFTEFAYEWGPGIVSNEPPEGFGVIPEVPLGTIVASAAMIIAFVAYVTAPKWRRKQQYVNL